VHHPDKAFADPTYATASLYELARAFKTWQEGRSKPIKKVSIDKYQFSIGKLLDFMSRSAIPRELQYLHPNTIDGWVADCRRRGITEDSIASMLTCIKVWSNQFILKHRDYTNADLLRKVARITPPEKSVDILTADEIEAVLSSFGEVTFEDIRNRAFFSVLLATGMRLREASELTMDRWEPAFGRFTIHGKGDRIRYAVIGDRALKYFQLYLRMRPKHTSHMVWLQRDGAPIVVGGWHMVFRRMKQASGVTRVRAHLLRHTAGSVAINKGAERALVQDMLGHASDFMTRRYTREARKQTAAAMMPQFSAI